MSHTSAFIFAALVLTGAAACSTTPSSTTTMQQQPGAKTGLSTPPFQARGNEPGWSLKIEDDRMTLVRDYGKTVSVFPKPKAAAAGCGVRFQASIQAQTVIVRIEDRLCRDDMSGMPHPKRVSVEIDGGILRGCGGDPVDLLTGALWHVEDIAGESVAGNRRVTLNLSAEGRLWGKGPCNRYTASYRLGEGLSVGPVASTKMACPPALMEGEENFFRMLGAVHRFDIAPDGSLILITPAGDTVTASK